jgi:hypothetical protein
LFQRLKAMKEDQAAGTVRICFGSRKLFRAQFALEANGYKDHSEWKADWLKSRSSQFFVLGSKDETEGNQSCQAKVEENGTLRLTLRLPNALLETQGKFLLIPGVKFAYGQDAIVAALASSARVKATTATRNRMKTGGSARKKISPERILDSYYVSPDGRWVAAETPGSGDEEQINLGTTKAFAVDGTATVSVCVGYCMFSWDRSGGFVYLSYPEKGETSYPLPVMRDSELSKLPSVVAARIEDVGNLKKITAIPWQVESAVNPSIYAYTRQNTRRNLYRIQLP